MYLRASCKSQDATRAQDSLEHFAEINNLTIEQTFIENDSGAKLERVELMKLLDVAEKGDILLIEKIDRISRLAKADWEELKIRLTQTGVTLVVASLPTTHAILKEGGDTWTLSAINTLVIELAAEHARDDYETRRLRVAQGIAKNGHKFIGKQVSEKTVKAMKEMKRQLELGNTITNALKVAGISQSTYRRQLKGISQSKKA